MTTTRMTRTEFRRLMATPERPDIERQRRDNEAEAFGRLTGLLILAAARRGSAGEDRR